MATPTLSPLSQVNRLRAKDFLFAFIGLMIAYVIFHNERFLIDAKDPIWNHYEPFKWWLLPHGLAAACALLLAPMQFSDRLRQRFTKIHRVVGRIYVAGVLIGAPLGAYLQFFKEGLGGTRSFSIATVVDAALWMITTGIAFGFILKGRTLQHRQWMTRSFAVAIVFLEVRVIAGITGWETQGDKAFEPIVWVCLAFSLLFADIVIQWQELSRTRRT
ncbi:MAG: hypothetical protein JWO20_2888 [Candidatus Angelobacter sp.]|nr:hypothetical protein [Candidatus Angelobacter sp.]